MINYNEIIDANLINPDGLTIRENNTERLLPQFVLKPVASTTQNLTGITIT